MCISEIFLVARCASAPPRAEWTIFDRYYGRNGVFVSGCYWRFAAMKTTPKKPSTDYLDWTFSKLVLYPGNNYGCSELASG